MYRPNLNVALPVPEIIAIGVPSLGEEAVGGRGWLEILETRLIARTISPTP